MHRLLFAFLLLTTTLIAEEGERFFDENAPANSSCQVTTMVNDRVSAITGDWCDSEVDAIIPGPLPLVIQRSYTSSDNSQDFLYRGWHLNHPQDLITSGHMENLSAYCGQYSGGKLKFIDTLKSNFDRKKGYKPLVISFPDGGTIIPHVGSGRSNVKNCHLVYYEKSKQCIVTSGASDVRYFMHNKKDDENHYNLIKDQKANGNAFMYGYDNDQRITAISSLSPSGANIFSWLTFDYSRRRELGKYLTTTIQTSDSQEINYQFKRYTCKDRKGAETQYHYLKEVTSNRKPTITYEYSKKESIPYMHVSEKNYGNGRFEGVKYYQKGVNLVAGQTIDIEETKDFRLDRVAELLSPIGVDTTPIATHKFIYYEDQKTANKPDGERKDKSSGRTEVYNALNHLSIYHYSRSQRLKFLTSYRGTGHPYQLLNTQGFVWGKKGSPNEGNLLCKYDQDSYGNLNTAQTFTYDHNGNVLVDILYGNLVGNTKKPVLLSSDGNLIENGCDRYIKRFEYSKKNLVTKEYEPNGREIHYSYDDKDQLIAKYVAEKGLIKIRNFYFYDECGNQIKHIRDNGSSSRLAVLNDVTEQHTTVVTPRKGPTAQGLPEVVSEFGLDIASKNYFLIKKVVFTYNNAGKKIREDVYDALSNYCFSNHWEYDTYGRVTKETNGLGQYSESRYDDNGNLIFEQGPNKNSHQQHTYDFCNRRIRTEEFHSNGTIFVTTLGYDLLGNIVKKTDRYGNETDYVYNELNKPVIEFGAYIPDANGVPTRPILQNEYDDFGHLKKIVNAKGEVTQISYNSRGQPLVKQNFDGTTESCLYYYDGSIAQTIAKDGVKTNITYDYLGRPLTKTLYGNDGQYIGQESNVYDSFHLISSTDLMGVTTYNTYDQAGRLIKTTKDEQVVEFVYDFLGRCVQKREWFGLDAGDYRVEVSVYDLLNRVIEERIEDSSGKVFSKKQFVFDSDGNTVQTISAISEVEQSISYTEFNSEKLPVKMFDELGNATYVMYNHDYYNAYGQRVLQTTTTDAKGNQLISTFDVMQRIACTERKNPLGVVFYKKEYFYDLIGNQTSTVDTIYKLSLEKEVLRTVTTKWEYCSSNQVSAHIEAFGTPEQKTSLFAYNRFAQKEIFTKPDGVQIYYVYDGKGRLKAYRDSKDTVHYSYSYDWNDNPTLVEDVISGTHTERTYSLTGSLLKEKQGHGLEIEYQYDMMGRVRKVILPDGSAMGMTYDAVNLVAVSRFDQNGERLYEHTNETFDLRGKPLGAKLLKQAGEVSYQYDLKGRLVAVKHEQFDQEVPESGYDSIGNIVKLNTKDAEGFYEQSFAYDELNQIVSEVGPYEHKYVNDSLCNRLSKDVNESTLNSLHQVLSDGTYEYCYDENGNQIGRKSAVKENKFFYDGLDRLVKVVGGGVEAGVEDDVGVEGIECCYAYDAFNRRLSKTICKGDTKTVERYIYLGENEVGRVDEQGKIVEFRLLQAGCASESSYAVAFELDNQVLAPVYDQAGNVSCLLKANGDVAASYRYSVFGEETVCSGSDAIEVVHNPWRYASKRSDSETGYLFFGRRYYDPHLGRWITPDPIGLDGGPNLYAYVLNNPLIHPDFFGCYPAGEPSTPLLNLIASAHQESHSMGGVLTPYKYKKNARYYYNSTAFRNGRLPIVKYDDSFEERHNGYPGSKNGFYEGSLGDGKPDIIQQPGVQNTEKTSEYNAKVTSELAGGRNVITIGNFTHGPWDFVESFFGLFGFISTKPSRLLQEKWREHFDKYGPNTPLLMICHSQGAIHVRNALLDFPEELRKQIVVIAVAPAAYIDPKLCKGVTHLVSKRDLVPRFDRLGRQRYKETIEYLDPAKGTAWLDHSFDSATYKERLKQSINNFYKE